MAQEPTAPAGASGRGPCWRDVRIPSAREGRMGRVVGSWVSLAVGLSVSSVAYAGTGVWTTGGPYGGTVRALAIDPTTPATLYAGTGGGVFKSTDSGGTWAAANTGLTNLDVAALAIDPTTPDHALRRDGRRRGLQVHRLRRHLDRRQHGPDEPGRLRPGHRSHDPRHALRRDVRRRGLQVHRLRRHLDRRQHGPDGPDRLRPGHRSHDPRHALRRDETAAGSSSPPTPAAPGPPPTRA